MKKSTRQEHESHLQEKSLLNSLLRTNQFPQLIGATSKGLSEFVVSCCYYYCCFSFHLHLLTQFRVVSDTRALPSVIMYNVHTILHSQRWIGLFVRSYTFSLFLSYRIRKPLHSTHHTYSVITLAITFLLLLTAGQPSNVERYFTVQSSSCV